MTKSRVAQRYARAIMEIAQSEKSLDAVIEDIRTLGGAIEGSHDLQTLLAEMHKHNIHRQPMQPRREGRLTAKCSDLPKQLQERFLGEIFRLGRIRDHAQTERVHPAFVKAVQHLKRFGVTLFCALNRFGFGEPCSFRVGQVAFSGRTL